MEDEEDEKPFWTPGLKPKERMASPGFRLWTLTNGSRTLVCELRDDDRRGAGVDVQILEDGEMLVTTRCMTGDGARYVANAYKQDHLRTGWTEIIDGATDV